MSQSYQRLWPEGVMRFMFLPAEGDFESYDKINGVHYQRQMSMNMGISSTRSIGVRCAIPSFRGSAAALRQLRCGARP